MAFFITILNGNLRGVFFKALVLFLFLVLRGPGISSGYSSGITTQLFASSLVTLFLLFSSGFVKRLLKLRAFFGLVDLIIGLKDFLICLIIPRIETCLQKMFFFKALLIQVDISLNLGLSFCFIGYIDQIIPRYILAYISNL